MWNLQPWLEKGQWRIEVNCGHLIWNTGGWNLCEFIVILSNYYNFFFFFLRPESSTSLVMDNSQSSNKDTSSIRFHSITQTYFIVPAKERASQTDEVVKEVGICKDDLDSELVHMRTHTHTHAKCKYIPPRKCRLRTRLRTWPLS